MKAESERTAALGDQSIGKSNGNAESRPVSDATDVVEFLLPRVSAAEVRPKAPDFAHANWKLDAKYLFDAEKPQENVAVAAEEFRSLASSLHVARSTRQLVTLLISSVLPGEGKSTTALNLAYALAQNRGRVLLVDGDLRNSKLHAILGAENKCGFADYLQDRADQALIVQKGPIENLYFVPAGMPTRHPSELITSSRGQQFFEWAKRQFDWVVLDTPPAGVVSDASIMSLNFDGVLLVIRSGQTPYDLAERVRLSFPRERLLGVILNWAEKGRTYDDYYFPQYRKP